VPLEATNPPDDEPAKAVTSPEVEPAEATAPPEDEPAEAAAPSEDEAAEAKPPPEVAPIEVYLEDFLASHTTTDEQVSLLTQFITGARDPTTIWANLVESIMDSIALSVADDTTYA
jgi:hypothetical protein